jgi:calcium-dependent protein kinase
MDFKTMRDAFRAIDITNSGIITIDQIKKGFVHDNYVTYLDNDDIEKIFSRFDFNKNGEVNYSEFMAATVDKKKALTKANLQFAFHYFDTDNEGYITKDDLKEVFRRQGQQLSD